MKTIIAASLVTAQIATAAPAFSAEIADVASSNASTRTGAFAGARLRVPFGAAARQQTRLGLTVAPLQQRRSANGDVKLSFGEGLEYGIAGKEPVALRFAGQRFSPGRNVDGKGQKLGVSTIGAVAIGAGVVLVSAVGIALIIRGSEN